MTSFAPEEFAPEEFFGGAKLVSMNGRPKISIFNCIMNAFFVERENHQYSTVESRWYVTNGDGNLALLTEQGQTSQLV